VIDEFAMARSGARKREEDKPIGLRTVIDGLEY